MMPARVRSLVARVAGAMVIVFTVALAPAFGDGLRGDALPLSSSAPRVDGEPLAPGRPDCPPLAQVPLAPVPRPPAPFGPAVLQDKRGGALDGFYRALAGAAAGRGVARIMYFGDSHVATDSMTGRIRDNLQSRFGDAGVGFFLPAKPLRWYSHATVELGKGKGWTVLAVRKAHDLERRVGPSGFALLADGRASAAVRLRGREAGDRRGARLQVFYLQVPAGGHARVVVDGHETTTWSTATDSVVEAPAYFETTLPQMPEQLEVATLGDGPVTLYGITLERAGAGVVLDTLGIPGARAKDHLLWDDAMYREHLAKRAPDLVVLAYGTNEGTDTREPIAVYERQLRQVLARVHAAVPGASCLLIGPTDHPQRVAGRGFRARKRTQRIIEVERRLAAEHGCGFIDLVSVTGGPMSMVRMVSRQFAGKDHTHFTRRGYEALGDAISGALVGGFRDWREATCTAAR